MSHNVDEYTTILFISFTRNLCITFAKLSQQLWHLFLERVVLQISDARTVELNWYASNVLVKIHNMRKKGSIQGKTIREVLMLWTNIYQSQRITVT